MSENISPLTWILGIGILYVLINTGMYLTAAVLAVLLALGLLTQ